MGRLGTRLYIFFKCVMNLLPHYVKSVKYLSLYAQDSYEYLNSSVQLSDVSQALTVVGREIYCKVSVK